MRLLRFVCVGLLVASFGCDGGSGVDGGVGDGGASDAGPLVVPSAYTYESRFVPGASSVNYGGQTARHVIIEDLASYVGSLTDAVDTGSLDPAETVVVSNLEYFFSLDASDRVDDPIRLMTDPPADQTTYGELSGSAVLLAKVAGNDTVTDYRDWSTEFVGWSDPSIAMSGGGVGSPTELVRAIFETLEANAIARGAGASRMSPVASPMPLPVHVTESGIDLQRLLAEFLVGAIGYSQAADDYMDDDVEGKGLLSENAVPQDGRPYTTLERAWDEAFGYLGASRFYGDRSAEELATGPRYVDSDMSGGIDLQSEYSFGVSVNAAERDQGATAPTDFMGTVWTAFVTGRAIIAQGPIDEERLNALRVQRDAAMGAWEAVIAATAVHYINVVLQIMEDFDTPAYDHARFLAHAEAWSALKGFALRFQFSPRSTLSSADFAMLHTLIADAPVLPAAGSTDADAYRTALRDARALLGTAYGFEPANLGDDVGAGGW